MLLFIRHSMNRISLTHGRYCLGVAALVVAALALALGPDALLFARRLADPAYLFSEAPDAPPSEDFVQTYAHDTAAYFFGVDPEAMAAARRAPVLFVGASTIMNALSNQVFIDEFAARGMPAYALGFSASEGTRFSTMLFQKHGLLPKVVVVGEFGEAFSNFGPARMIVGKSELVAYTLPVEGTALRLRAVAVLNRIKRWVFPHLDGVAAPRLILPSRSRSTGIWATRDLQGGFAIVPSRASDPLDEVYVDKARAFKAFVEARGTRLILTQPPVSHVQGNRPGNLAELLAQRLGVPAVVPKLEGLTGIDPNHLDYESSERWTRALVAEMDARGLLPQAGVR